MTRKKTSFRTAVEGKKMLFYPDVQLATAPVGLIRNFLWVKSQGKSFPSIVIHKRGVLKLYPLLLYDIAAKPPRFIRHTSKTIRAITDCILINIWTTGGVNSSNSSR